MIVYRLIDELHCPIFICDACGRQITEMGNVYWIAPLDETTYPRLWHTHKFACAQLDRRIEEETGEFVLSEELDQWIHQLGYNFAAKRKGRA